MPQPYAYLRKSSVRDPSKEMAPETQEREVRALAERHGDAEIEILADWDISGRAKFTAKRTGYLKLVEAIQAAQVSAVYSYSLSRLGRSTAELARFFELCQSRHIPIRLVADAVDTSTASGRMLATILASVAVFEAEVASERLLTMYETKRERARAAGLDPRDAVRTSRRYGEAAGADPDLVLKLFRETHSYGKTAKRLNEMGVKPMRAKSWWASSVKIVVDRLDPEVGAQPNAPRSPRGGVDFTLAKLLRCGTCGATLTGSRVADKKGKRLVRYVCHHVEAMPHRKISIAEHLVLSAIIDEAARYWERDEPA
ncbi:MAG: recombinase family protein, partial [Candidatus Limnocylindrales bacterium]